MDNKSGRDALGALLGLGVLGSVLGNDTSPLKHDEEKLSPNDTAREAMTVFNSYVAAGFTTSQAFDLLKIYLGKVER